MSVVNDSGEDVVVTLTGRQFVLAAGASTEEQFPASPTTQELTAAPASGSTPPHRYGVELVAGFRIDLSVGAAAGMCDVDGQPLAVFVRYLGGGGTF